MLRLFGDLTGDFKEITLPSEDQSIFEAMDHALLSLGLVPHIDNRRGRDFHFEASRALVQRMCLEAAKDKNELRAYVPGEPIETSYSGVRIDTVD
jgi:hypothetical protein